jgi:ribosomal protein S18 acetylase RimI-like enzyme
LTIISQLLKIVPARRFEHLTFNLCNFNFFRKSEGGKAMLFFGNSGQLALLIALPYVLGCELAFFREERYFVKLKKQVVGVFVLREKSDALYVGSLGVAPEYRKHGVATFILSHCAQVAKRLGKEWLELAVLKTNIPARQLYEKFGFLNKEERKWSFVMRKRINSNELSSSSSMRKS